MIVFARLSASVVPLAALLFVVPVAADFDGPSGYGNEWRMAEFEVSHDGYVREGQPAETVEPSDYVIIETEEGAPEQVDGDTVIVVQEPEPVAAMQQAPPPPQTVVVADQVPACAGGIWVDGYWYYSNGQYLWVDGHCVVQRVNYVFVHPRWDFYASIWWFVPGYYRPCGVWVGFGYYRPWHWYPPYFHPYYPSRYPVPVNRSVPLRPTTARPTPATGSTPATGTTPIYRTPTGRMLSPRTGRTGAAPTITSTVPRPRPGSSFVTRPRPSRSRTRTFGRSSSGPSWSPSSSSSSSPSRGFSGGRTRTSPSRSSSPAPSSGSSGRGWGGSRSTPPGSGR